MPHLNVTHVNTAGTAISSDNVNGRTPAKGPGNIADPSQLPVLNRAKRRQAQRTRPNYNVGDPKPTRFKNTPENHERMIRQIKAQQEAAAGVEVQMHEATAHVGADEGADLSDALPDATQASATAESQQADGGLVGQLGRWASAGGAYMWSKLPNPGLLAAADAAPAKPAPVSDVKKASPSNQESVLIIGGMTAGTYVPGPDGEMVVQRIEMDEIGAEVKHWIGTENVHVIGPKRREDYEKFAYPYLRNLATQGPDGLVTTANNKQDPRRDSTRDAIEKFADENAVASKRLKNYANLANVEYIPTSDLLVLASTSLEPLSGAAVSELKKVFHNPANVIHLELDQTVKGEGMQAPACYDLDLAFHATRSATGKNVALIHESCILQNPQRAPVGREQVKLQLEKLGYAVIEISARDQRNLATNSLSIGDRPGEMLFSTTDISPGLKKRLMENGITPRFPKKGIGATKGISHFGLHCFTLNLRPPKEKGGDLEKSEL